MNGEQIIRSIEVMHDRSNGLGGGFAAYGIYPEYKEYYAFHIFYDDISTKQECERFLNRHVMEKTLGPVNREAKAEMEAAPDGANQLNLNLEKRVIMAKLLLMCQIGRFDEKREDGKTKPYEDTLAEAFSHGGRTKFALPYGGNQKAVLKSVMEDPAHPAGLKSRASATHYVSAQKVDANGNTVSEMREERPKANLFKIMSKQYGMNVAVGGMGEMGPHKERIMADGRNFPWSQRKVGEAVRIHGGQGRPRRCHRRSYRGPQRH